MTNLYKLKKGITRTKINQVMVEEKYIGIQVSKQGLAILDSILNYQV